MPRGGTSTEKTDKHAALDESIAKLAAQLKHKLQEKRRQSRHDYAAYCLEIGKVVEACGLFTCDHEDGRFACDLGEVEAVLKLGMREAKRKGRAPAETEEPPDVG